MSNHKKHPLSNSINQRLRRAQLVLTGDRRRNLIIIISIFIIFIATILTASIMGARRSATLSITVAPSFATITINDQTYQNGTYRLEPTMEPLIAAISADGFTTKTQTIELTASQTTELLLYLTPENGSLDWYLKHPDEMMLMNQIGDRLAGLKSLDYESQHPIISILPIIIVEVSDTYDWTEYRIDGGEFADCPTDFCLQITDTTGGNRDAALNQIRQKGFNPDDFEILYRYTPIEQL